jgi:hypothetical protein
MLHNDGHYLRRTAGGNTTSSTLDQIYNLTGTTYKRLQTSTTAGQNLRDTTRHSKLFVENYYISSTPGPDPQVTGTTEKGASAKHHTLQALSSQE